MSVELFLEVTGDMLIVERREEERKKQIRGSN
jgi:hypothetical protein